MDARIYTTMSEEKRSWGDGPWLNEPDKVQWKDPSTGLACLAKRNHWGAWCGYVGVHPEHRLYGVDYTEISVDVHGGLTYSDVCEEGPEESSICHVPDPGEPDKVWWLGFDCGHSFDLSPGMRAFENELSEHGLSKILAERGYRSTYRTLDYVRGEIVRLASQLATH